MKILKSNGNIADLDIFYWNQIQIHEILTFTSENVELYMILFWNIVNIFYWKCGIRLKYSWFWYFLIKVLKTNGNIDEFDISYSKCWNKM